MIAFDLKCGSGHSFEGWFASSQDFDAQKSGGQIVCPLCNTANVEKALSVPNVGRKSNQGSSLPAERPVTAEPVTGEVMNAPALSPAMVEMASACDGRLTRKPSIDLLDAISAHDLR